MMILTASRELAETAALTLSECFFTDMANAVTVIEGHDKVHPFLVTVGAFWTGEQLVHTGKSLVGQ